MKYRSNASEVQQGYLQNAKITTHIQQRGCGDYHAEATNVEIRLYLGGNQVGVVVGGREVIGENENGGAYVADERAIEEDFVKYLRQPPRVSGQHAGPGRSDQRRGGVDQ